ncbi:hypothetical protein Leryth_018381 [Lithospermum erythrorhizon]|nr:hypothetical protein Leryth_018381 [Lithospermum erythrorhizon]
MMRFFNRGGAAAEPPSPSPSLSTASDNSTTSISLPSSPIVAGPARPIRFVYCDDKGKFQIDPEALAVLQLVKDPVDGGIDETALDRLSLVTEMTKHIRVRASGGKTTASELGQFSPIFVWLLRDFPIDLHFGGRNKRITRYLELNKPIEVVQNNVAAKQRLRPEFKSGLDALTKFVFERTRPKQVGATIMTGPILARITQSFLDAINKGAVPTITSSWYDSVEESECQRAYELATEVYISSFDQTKLPEEDTAVGFGSTRQKYESRMQKFVKKAFECLVLRDAFREAHLQCLNAVQKMEKELRVACQSPNAKVDSILKKMKEYSKVEWIIALTLVLCDVLLLTGPILDVIKKQADHMNTEVRSIGQMLS